MTKTLEQPRRHTTETSSIFEVAAWRDRKWRHDGTGRDQRGSRSASYLYGTRDEENWFDFYNGAGFTSIC